MNAKSKTNNVKLCAWAAAKAAVAVDSIAEVHGFEPWKKGFQGWISAGRIGSGRVLLLKPATYMNDSGRSVGEALRFYKLDLSALTAFHDELDLDPFRVKVKTGGGAAGHNGLRSIDAHLGQDYRRVRLGIGHPGHKDRVTPWVLGKPGKDDEAAMLRAIDDAIGVLPLAVAGDLNEAMKRLHTPKDS